MNTITDERTLQTIIGGGYVIGAFPNFEAYRKVFYGIYKFIHSFF